MCESCPVMIADGRHEDLRFMLQSPEGLRMDNPVPVPLKAGPYLVFFLTPYSPPALRAPAGLRMKDLSLYLFCLLTNGHFSQKPVTDIR